MLETIAKNFKIEGEVKEISPYGNGHINDTYLLSTSKKRYILQRMNNSIFKNPEALMENIAGVTSFIREKVEKAGGDVNRETMNIIKSIEDKNFYVDSEGRYWRIYQFVEDTLCYDKIESKEDFYACALAFGRFQGLLADYPADKLYETIENFHNTLWRYENFLEAVDKNLANRKDAVSKEIEFIKAQYDFIKEIYDIEDSKQIPLRVTHNDTKLNNILFDKETKKGICVIDLDTVMPGYAINDFGDSVRFGANTALEDEQNLSLVSCDLELFRVFAKGFIEASKNALTSKEIELLPKGAMIMTLECGMRFLTDHLNGDVYFRVHRENHNLDRARTQIELYKDMQRKIEEMNNIIKDIYTS